MEDEVLSYSLCLIENVMIFLGMLNRLLTSRMKPTAYRILLPFAIITCATLLYFCGSYPIYLKCGIATLGIMTWACILYRDSLSVKLSFVLISIYALYIIDIIVGNFMSMVFDEHFLEVFYQSGSNQIVVCSITKVLDAFAIYYLYNAFKKINFTIQKKEWILLDIIASICLIITVVFIAFYPSIKMDAAASMLFCIVSIGFFIMSAIILYFFTELCAHFQKESKLHFLESTNTTLQQHILLQDQMHEKMKIVRHDIKNHTLHLQLLLHAHQYESANQYLFELNTNISELRYGIEQSCGNGVIDAVVSFKAAICESKNIAVRLNLEEIPKIVYPITDISAMLSNLLDNAIEAAEKVADNPFVEVKVFAYKSYITFTVRNSYRTVILDHGKLKTTKKNNLYHGYGTQIIREIAEQYGGNYTYHTLDGTFISSVIIPI